ncbi:MAG TPA: diaminopimelate decarboxylase, partial [Terriglobales bacterium]|nr:diaminopimelate decarboxylase [Terriglobales bacterium]
MPPKKNNFARPPAFTYRSGLLNRSRKSLHCDSVAVSKLADKFGTPLYVYSGSTVRERFRAFDGAFADVPHTVCYSV